MTAELLRTAPEYPGLKVAQDGRIQGPSGKWLRPFPDRNGYRRINLYEPPKRWTQVAVHAVVCTAFHGPRPEGAIVRHLDGNPDNNHADNLRWGTSKENEDDKLRHGRRLQGERHHQAKLTETQVFDIRSRPFYRGIGQDLAREYGVSESSISGIRKGKSWGHL